MLLSVGFQNLGQIDDCISGLDDDRLSRIALGGRGGQVSRFEVLLVVSMGESFLKGHPYAGLDWFLAMVRHWLEKLRKASVTVGSYQPKKTE